MTENRIPITASVEKITPEVAQELLGHNTSNRNLRRTVVDRYAEDMRGGNWSVTGASVTISDDGRLLDGQHRLHACVQAEIAFETLVTRGVPMDAQVNTDTGLRRLLADVLSLRGEKSCNVLASAIRTGWKWQDGSVMNTTRSPSNTQALEWLENNPTIREAVQRAGVLKNHFRFPDGTAAAFIHQASLIDWEETQAFIDSVRSGEGLERGSPTLVLREWLINQATAAGARVRPPNVTYHALIVKAWNGWVSGSQIRTLRWRRGGSSPEAFPELLDMDGLAVEIRDEVPAQAAKHLW